MQSPVKQPPELRSAWRSLRSYLNPAPPEPAAEAEPPPPPPLDRALFDPEFFRQFYRDEAAFSGQDDEALWLAFYRFGAKESWFGTPGSYIAHLTAEHGPLPDGFDAATYLDLHGDVAAAKTHPAFAAEHYLLHGRGEGRALQRLHTYSAHFLGLVTNRVHDLQQVVVDEDAPKRINVLVPAFDFRSMSAGFFGVFNVAKFIAGAGYRVRLLMFDNFPWDLASFKERLKGYPGLEDLCDCVDVEYCGERLRPIVVSPEDGCVATVWYSAYLAAEIMRKAGGGPFLYLIQDYEAAFYPNGSMSALADASYDFSHNALFSSESLMGYFENNRRGYAASPGRRREYFNNACSSSQPGPDFLSAPPAATRKLVVYARPEVNRNMFELAGLVLQAAIAEGVFAEADWEFIGFGLGSFHLDLAEGLRLRQMPRMNLRDYEAAVSSFDIGLTLMASAHPSLVPFDLGGAGTIVVTNTFANKDEAYFDALCRNVIAKPPTLAGLVDGLREAVARVGDREARLEAALQMRFPRRWADVFSDRHRRLLEDTFGSAGSPVGPSASGASAQERVDAG